MDWITLAQSLLIVAGALFVVHVATSPY